MTPEHETSTHCFFGAARNYNEDDAEFNAMQARMISGVFAGEDKPMVEAQQVAMGQSDL